MERCLLTGSDMLTHPTQWIGDVPFPWFRRLSAIHRRPRPRADIFTFGRPTAAPGSWLGRVPGASSRRMPAGKRTSW